MATLDGSIAANYWNHLDGSVASLYSKTMKHTSFRWTSQRKPPRRCHIYKQTASGSILTVSLLQANWLLDA